ncbi:LamG-like jellyroll fold domain-containing protein [Amycolatopsis sp. WAC 04197]|uniref:LamG-like jellyroll fold domain-containing protein n=1 Tax=Amycolatopsis sp. WAC 04197 TaxID=2203199 RepID=UPI001315335C|nr:LamG-like jellyroll fold domain-containing protein [Amycolatopsis sp. WAC 04197]
MVSFALDDERRLHYSVLDLDATPRESTEDEPGHAELDVRHWADDPRPAVFPRELARAGYAALGADSLPRVRAGGREAEDPDDVIPDDEIDEFLSGTGRLTALAPFQVVSDGKHIFLFRQAIAAGHADAVVRTESGALSGKSEGAAAVAVAPDALLCDRFVLAGGELRPVREVRYRRSRHRTRPASAKDTLGSTDMNEKPFLEPTLELGFAGPLTDGRFTVLVVPTAVSGSSRWQFFVYNARSGQIDSINVDQDEDGLFGTRGSLLYTSPDPAHRDSVLERSPGVCPFTRRPLVPVEPDHRFAESALLLAGRGHVEAPAPPGLGQGPYTIEAWIRWDGGTGTVLSTGEAGIGVTVEETGLLMVSHGESAVRATAEATLKAGEYTHVAVRYDGTEATLATDGRHLAPSALGKAVAGKKLLIGAKTGTEHRFTGVVDEVRVWTCARRPQNIVDTMRRRLVGDEPDLVAYYRFDEGSGKTCFDQSPRAAHATSSGVVEWTVSGAPVADHPGIRRDSFVVAGRRVTSGLAATLYHQQEEGVVGDGAVRPLKRQARLLLAWGSHSETEADNAPGRIAALDLAIGRDGRAAQLPDVVDLPVVGTAAEEVDPGEENRLRAELATLRERLKKADEGKRALQNDVKAPYLAQAALKDALAKATASLTGRGKRASCVVYATSGATGGMRHLTVRTGTKAGEFTPTAVSDPATEDEADQWEWDPVLGRLTSVKAGKALSAPGRYPDVTLGDGAGVLFQAHTIGGGYGRPSDEAEGKYVYGSHGYGEAVCWWSGKLAIRDYSGYTAYNGEMLELYPVPITPSGDAETAAVAAVKAAFARVDAISGAKAAFLAWDAEITELTTEIENKERRLGVITDGTKGRSTRSFPMSHLGQDRLGLGWSGALLGFATTSGSPFLSPSGTGSLGLYYRDERGRLTGVFYDTNVDRSTRRLAAGHGTTVLLTARDASVDLATMAISVTAGDSGRPDRCSLTLSVHGGDTETWRLLPRSAEDFAATLNGRRREPLAVGPLAGVKQGCLTLAAPGAVRALAEGSLVTVGEKTFVVTSAVAPGATEISVQGDPGTVPDDATVWSVSHGPDLVTHSRPGPQARYGSRYVTAVVISSVGDGDGVVADGEAAEGGEAQPPQWWSDLPGRALNFAATSAPPALPSTADLSAARLADDLTIEAWVRPAAGATAEDLRRVVHANTGDASTDSRFTFGFGPAATNKADGPRPLIAGVGDRFVTSSATVPPDRWSHVAATFRQSWALEFGNGVHAEAPHASDLNIGRDLTLEVFLRTGELGSPQGLLAKGRADDGRGHKVPYQLGLSATGKLVFSFENSDGVLVSHTSRDAITAGTFHRIAVVRKLGDSREEKKGSREISALDAAGKPVKMLVDTIETLVVKQWSEISFHIDGKGAGSVRHDDAPELSHPGPLDIGRTRRGATTSSFTGEISEIRIWNVAREAKDLGTDLPPADPSAPGTANSVEDTIRPQGLIAHWRFEENEGNAAKDESGAHVARLNGPKWTKNPDPKGSTFRFYIDGKATQATSLTGASAPAGGDYGPSQFTLGGRAAADGTTDRYLGVLEEVRVWRTTREEEQILDNLFGRLTGESTDLLAYYPFDDESTEQDADELLDHGPRGFDLALATGDGRPTTLMSTAPISSETPEVRPVFATGQPRFVQTISAVPSVSEYADVQRGHDRSTRGVLKRAYAYVQDGTWNLITGYKLGDLVSEWVGQVQFDPQLIGYIEGAPPIPSENLIATRRPNSLSYINATTVEFRQADQVVQTLSSASEKSLDAATAFKLSTSAGPDTLLITAPFGIGTATPAVETDFAVEGGGSLEFSNGWGDQTEVSEDTDTSRVTSVGLSGGWEAEPASEADKRAMVENGGRRFAPSNTGYALVQSETADVFALRVRHSGAVVAYRMLPNPDIPRDWNLLPFKINDRYTKQGTLDGMAGYVKQKNTAGEEVWVKRQDDAYADVEGQGERSYFKPAEAYRLKRRIVEDQQRRQAYYTGVSNSPLGEDPTQERARELLSRFTGPIPGPGANGGQGKEGDSFARRDIVNTYVWSADGGFFAESTGLTDMVTETTTGSYRFTGMASVGLSTGFEVFGVGLGFQMDASFGGSISRTRAKSKEASRSFSLEVKVDTPGDMQKYDKDFNPVFDAKGTPEEVPGRVDAYRFMTFYLDSDNANFEDFYGKVVDRTWLDSADPNAIELKRACQAEHKPPCWRVMHRVTFVSRKLPPLTEGAAAPLEKAMLTADIGSDYELVRRIEPYIDPALTDRRELREQVGAAIDRVLPELASQKEVVADLFATYHQLS